MNRSLLERPSRILAALLGGLLVSAAGCRTRSSMPPDDVTPGITVVGRGEASGTPDLARIDAGVQVRAPTVEAATSKANARMRDLISALGALGVAAEDVQTRNISVYEEREFQPPPPRPLPSPEDQAGTTSEPGAPQPGATTYVAQNMLAITVRDLDKLPEILGAATHAGANQMHGIRLELSDPSRLQSRAREQAFADARAQAEQLAALGGVKLGRIIAMQVGDAGPVTPYPMPMAARMEDTAAQVPVERGEVTVEQRVQVVYALDRE
jgi:hypothetical protein